MPTKKIFEDTNSVPYFKMKKELELLRKRHDKRRDHTINQYQLICRLKDKIIDLQNEISQMKGYK